MDITLTEQEIKSHPNYFELGKYVSEKYWASKSEILLNQDEFDTCVICGDKTPYLKTLEISNRIGYVEGAGQGCFKPKKCNIYNE